MPQVQRLSGKLIGGPDKVAAFMGEYYQKKLYFEFPGPDYSKPPNAKTAAVRRVRVFWVRWGLHLLGFENSTKCTCGRDLAPKRMSSSQADGVARPLLCFGGHRAWAVQHVGECGSLR